MSPAFLLNGILGSIVGSVVGLVEVVLAYELIARADHDGCSMTEEPPFTVAAPRPEE